MNLKTQAVYQNIAIAKKQKDRTAMQYGLGPSDWSRTSDNADGIVGGIMSPLDPAAERRNRSGMTNKRPLIFSDPEKAKKPHCNAVRFFV